MPRSQSNHYDFLPPNPALKTTFTKLSGYVTTFIKLASFQARCLFLDGIIYDFLINNGH